MQPISKGGIQGIITPVVQISYNQIKSGKNMFTHSEIFKKSLHSQRGVRLDLIQPYGHKNITNKRKSVLRVESKQKSYNQRSFVSSNEAHNNKSPKLLTIKSGNHSCSIQPTLHQGDTEEDGVDECITGEDILNNRANSVNESVKYNKRLMSEMQKRIKKTTIPNKAPKSLFNKFKERNKNQMFWNLNGVKTVSLNNLTETTISGDYSNAKPKFNMNKMPISVSKSGVNINLKREEENTQLNWSENNSICSLKLNEKNWMIDLGNKSKAISFYSPLARERSNTINLSKEMVMNKCKSSKSISSNDKNNVYQLKSSINMMTTTPSNNIKLSARRYEGIKTTTAVISEQKGEDNFGENWRIVHTIKNNFIKGINPIQNNIDVQKVREAILGSIDNSNTEYGAHERRKLRFLNSIDENKDLDLLKK